MTKEGAPNERAMPLPSGDKMYSAKLPAVSYIECRNINMPKIRVDGVLAIAAAYDLLIDNGQLQYVREIIVYKTGYCAGIYEGMHARRA